VCAYLKSIPPVKNQVPDAVLARLRWRIESYSIETASSG
jgi:hypothetical protein